MKHKKCRNISPYLPLKHLVITHLAALNARDVTGAGFSGGGSSRSGRPLSPSDSCRLQTSKNCTCIIVKKNETIVHSNEDENHAKKTMTKKNQSSKYNDSFERKYNCSSTIRLNERGSKTLLGRKFTKKSIHI